MFMFDKVNWQCHATFSWALKNNASQPVFVLVLSKRTTLTVITKAMQRKFSCNKSILRKLLWNPLTKNLEYLVIPPLAFITALILSDIDFYFHKWQLSEFFGGYCILIMHRLKDFIINLKLYVNPVSSLSMSLISYVQRLVEDYKDCILTEEQFKLLGFCWCLF